MSREEEALEAVQALIPDDSTLDVALTYPRGFTRNQAAGSLIGHWDNLTPMVRFDRSTLVVEVNQHAVTLDITLTDTEHHVSLQLEAKRMGSLDAKALIELLTTPPGDGHNPKAS